MASIVKTEQETFRNDILAITEKEIPIESIRSNLFYLELAWDVEKPTVIPLIDGFKDSFFRHFCDFAEEQQSLKMGRKGRRKGDGYLANNHSFLKAHPVEGEIYKIYTKAVDVIRFEATIEGRRLKQFLDPNLDLTNPSAVENQFKVLAPKYYRHITQIQQWASSVCEIPSILDIFLCRCHPSTAKRMKELIQQLVINGFVHNQGSRYTRELQKLKKLGFIEYFKKGRWRLKPEAKSAFRPLRDMLMGDYAGIKPEGDIRGG
ncbi:MAG: hypothetical protein A2V67_15055 [Deltaproteobacteria bacterium RBG_13_61_14]|nr:MAG: hypothetical protein A2V67_15055 [Deltaproteobacteria bacterium RBG_13_61_14]